MQSGLALYDVMRAISCPVHTVCIGTAASMAALLFVAGDRRDMLPHSRVMIRPAHRLHGGRRAIREGAGDLMRIRDITAAVVAEHTGMTLDQVFQLTA